MLKTVKKLPTNEPSDKLSPAEIYEKLSDEMWSDNPDPIRLAVLTGAVDMLRLHCNFEVPEIEMAYIRLNQFTDQDALRFLREGSDHKCQQKFSLASGSSTH